MLYENLLARNAEGEGEECESYQESSEVKAEIVVNFRFIDTCTVIQQTPGLAFVKGDA